jgi:hypothetical protein
MSVKFLTILCLVGVLLTGEPAYFDQKGKPLPSALYDLPPSVSKPRIPSTDLNVTCSSYGTNSIIAELKLANRPKRLDSCDPGTLGGITLVTPPALASCDDLGCSVVRCEYVGGDECEGCGGTVPSFPCSNYGCQSQKLCELPGCGGDPDVP